MTTANSVFKMAMDIADEVDTAGTYTSADYAEYKARTPGILTLLEAELLKEGEIFNTYTLTDTSAPFSTASADDVWLEISMPTDFKSLDRVITKDSSDNYVNVDYKWQNPNTLIFPAQFEGTLTVNYHAVPTVITALTDTLHVDDITARTLLPYALAAELFKMESEEIFNYCNARYQQLKKGTVKKAEFVDTVDYYGW